MKTLQFIILFSALFTGVQLYSQQAFVQLANLNDIQSKQEQNEFENTNIQNVRKQYFVINKHGDIVLQKTVCSEDDLAMFFQNTSAGSYCLLEYQNLNLVALRTYLVSKGGKL